jgi:hypothetical protein
MKIDFEPITHRYALDGRAVPNVTRVIGDLRDLSAIPLGALERKRSIGAALHRAIELDLEGELDPASIDPNVSGYFTAWRSFLSQKRFECYLVECRVASKKYRYAGTLDLVGEMDANEVLIDAKASREPHPAARLQTAAYLQAACEMGFLAPSTRRFALYLHADTSYTLEPHAGRDDLAVFLACLARYNWRVGHRLIKDPA